jgi:peptidoglycan/LPS O-acetylase OafA/YrhL
MVMSGFLASRLLLKLTDGQAARAGAGGDGSEGAPDSARRLVWTDLAYYWLHRLWRILPLYAVAIGLYTFIVPVLGSGPFWNSIDAWTNNCYSWWWTNLLFVNNYVPWTDNFESECMVWTWYLALDMQFYIATPAAVLLYLWQPTLAAFALCALLAASMITASEIVATEGVSSIIDMSVPTSALSDYFNDYYSKAWTRAPAYLVGIGLALAVDTALRARRAAREAEAAPANSIGVETYVAMHRQGADGAAKAPRRPPYKLTRRARWGWQLAALATMLACMYGSVGGYAALPNPWSLVQNTSYTILTRPAWSLSLAALLFFSFTHQGGMLSKVLSVPGWEPPAKLTYAAYLVHPMVTQVSYYTSTQYFRFTGIALATAFVSTLVFSYITAALLYLAVERPSKNLEALGLRWLAAWRRGRVICCASCRRDDRDSGGGGGGARCGCIAGCLARLRRRRSKLDSDAADGYTYAYGGSGGGGGGGGMSAVALAVKQSMSLPHEPRGSYGVGTSVPLLGSLN